jgi:hypothetical protein
MKKFCWINILSIESVPEEIRDYGAIFEDGEIALSILKFYARFNGFSCKWHSKWEEADVSGTANFLKFERVLVDWKGTIYPDNTAPSARIVSFHPIDFFHDNACVGFYKGADKNESLYFYDFVHEPKNLQLNVDGYLQLLVYVRAFRYWPYLILEILHNERSPTGEFIRENMVHLFDDFDMETFKRMYSENRLDK